MRPSFGVDVGEVGLHGGQRRGANQVHGGVTDIGTATLVAHSYSPVHCAMVGSSLAGTYDSVRYGTPACGCPAVPTRARRRPRLQPTHGCHPHRWTCGAPPTRIPSRDARGRAVPTVATRRSYGAVGSRLTIVSMSSSAVMCHLSQTRWPLDSKPAMPWAFVSSNAP
jgi:hypothetical protein